MTLYRPGSYVSIFFSGDGCIANACRRKGFDSRELCGELYPSGLLGSLSQLKRVLRDMKSGNVLAAAFGDVSSGDLSFQKLKILTKLVTTCNQTNVPFIMIRLENCTVFAEPLAGCHKLLCAPCFFGGKSCKQLAFYLGNGDVESLGIFAALSLPRSKKWSHDRRKTSAVMSKTLCEALADALTSKYFALQTFNRPKAKYTI